MQTFWSTRRVFLTALIGIILLLLGIAIVRDYGTLPDQTRGSASSTATPTRHQTYQFAVQTPPRERVWYLGQSKVFRWVPTPIALTDAPTPTKVVLVVNLYGPFPTREDADQQSSQWFNSPPGTVTLPSPALTSIPLTTDDWSNRPQQTIVSLPASLASGYYVWDARATTEQGGSSATGLTVQLISP